MAKAVSESTYEDLVSLAAREIGDPAAGMALRAMVAKAPGGDPRSAPPLLLHLAGNPGWGLRSFSALMLPFVDIPANHVLPALEAAAADPEFYVRFSARYAIRLIERATHP